MITDKQYTDLFNSIFFDSQESPILDSDRQEVFILFGKLGYKQGVRKILGVYPTETQAHKRAKYCQDSGDMDLLFRKYQVAKIVVGSEGSNIEMEF